MLGTKAAALLKLSERQVRRLYGAFQRRGAGGLASRRRGQLGASVLSARAKSTRTS